MRETQLQIKLPGVPKEAKQGREVAPKWAWTEASVWTERMLATLERGIKGGKWYSLIDKVWKMENLQNAVDHLVRNKSKHKPDGQRCWRYAEQADWRLPALQDKLQKGEYQPQPVRRVWIPKLGSKELRPLGIPPVENRVVEMAVRQVIEPIFEQTFAEQSYGFRPGRGAKDALRRVQQLLGQPVSRSRRTRQRWSRAGATPALSQARRDGKRQRLAANRDGHSAGSGD